MRNTTNPYSIGVAPDHAQFQNNVKDQLNQFKREEDMAKAPLVTPFPLDNKIEPLLSTILLSLEQIRGELLSQLRNNPAADEKKTNILTKKIQQINSNILELVADLRTIAL